MAVRKEAIDWFKLSPCKCLYINIMIYIYIYVHIYIYIHVYLSSTSPCLILLTVCIYRCPFAQMWNAMVNIRKKYLVVFVRVDQAHFGEPVSRRRIYILCVRRPSVSASQRLPFDLFAMISSWIKLPLFAQGTSPCESWNLMKIWRSTVKKHTRNSQKPFLRDPLCHLTLLVYYDRWISFILLCFALSFMDSYDP